MTETIKPLGVDYEWVGLTPHTRLAVTAMVEAQGEEIVPLDALITPAASKNFADLVAIFRRSHDEVMEHPDYPAILTIGRNLTENWHSPLGLVTAAFEVDTVHGVREAPTLILGRVPLVREISQYSAARNMLVQRVRQRTDIPRISYLRRAV